MSHITTLRNIAIKDVQAMRAAVADLKNKGINIDLLENAQPRGYGGRLQPETAFVLKLHDAAYDVGLTKNENGEYVPGFDEWSGAVGEQIGASCPMPDTSEGRAQHCIGQFLQAYGKHAAINAAVAQGMSVESTSTDADGNVHISLIGA